MATRHTVSTMMIVLVFAAFVSIGLPDALFGSAWPSMKLEFNRSNAAVGLLNIPGSIAYIASSAMLGTVMRKLSIAQLLSTSTALVAIGLSLYALAPSFWAIIPAVMLISAGSGAIDAALNLFAAQNLPTRYMSWLHAFYGVGALAGPFVMAVMFGMGHSWRWGYAAIAMVLWVMALIFVITHSQWDATTDADDETSDEGISGRNVLRMPRVQLSMLMFMGGSAAECLAALWISSILIQRFETSESWGAIGLGVYWIALTAGRILIPVLWPNSAPLRVQRWSTILVLLASVLMLANSLVSTSIGIVLAGIGIASIFPFAMSITSERFGPAVSSHAVGYMISASTVMYALMPPLSGWLADVFGFASVAALMLAGGVLLLVTQMLLVRGDTPAPGDIL